MVRGTDYENLEKWFQEKHDLWAQIISIRAALRLFPVLDYGINLPDIDDRVKNNLILDTWRNCFNSSIIASSPVHKLNLSVQSSAYAKRTVDTIDFHFRNRKTAKAVYNTAYSSIYAARVAADITYETPTRPGSDAKQAVSYSLSAARGLNISRASKKALKTDIDYLESRRGDKYAEQDLLSSPLWIAEQSPLKKDWLNLKKSLIEIDRNWQFLSDWYEAKLDGTTHAGLSQPYQEQLYYEIATLPIELWEAGAEVVNKKIIQLLEEVNIVQPLFEPENFFDSLTDLVNTNTSPNDFLLSYSAKDEVIATKVAQIIKEAGYSVHLSSDDILESNNWVTELQERVKNSSRFICLYSENYWVSKVCQQEWNAARIFDPRGKHSKIIPFLISKCEIPPSARRLFYKNLIDLNDEEFRDAVLVAIQDDKFKSQLDLELPPQNESVLQFKTNEDGIIELDKEANENELLNDQDDIDRHKEVDYLANELISTYDPNSSSSNAARPIVTKVQRYLEALGDIPEEANINFIIPRGEVLRQELEQEKNRDEFTNSPPLPDNFKSSLSSLVRAHNLYVLLDPVLDKRDQARLGPDAKENLVSKEEGLKFVEDVFNEGLIEEEIAEAFNEEAETVHDTPDPERRQDRRFSESIKNLSRLLLSNTQKIAKKVKEKQEDILEVTVAGVAGVGGGVLVTGGAIVVSSASWTVIGSIVGTGYTCFKGLQWIVKNEEWIIQRFDNKEEIKAFIEALKKLPLK